MNVSQSVSKRNIALLQDLLARAHRIAIVCHARPDGDAVGSMTALAQVLSKLGHDVLCIAPTAVPAPLRWVAGFELVKTFSLDGQYISRELPSVQLFFHVDHNSLSRVDPQLEQALRACNAPRVMIDHHLHPESADFSLCFSRPQSSSTCELLYEIIHRAWGKPAISRSVAECLYMGILTDTGSFAHSCSNKRTYEVAGTLVELGVDVPAVRDHVLGSYSLERYRLYGTAMASKTDFFANGQAAIISLSDEFLSSAGFSTGDTEGLVNEPLTVQGVIISALLSERHDGGVRVSLRSRGHAEVNAIARAHFNGGGHPQASGGTLYMPLRKASLFVRLVIAEAIKTGDCFPSR